MLTSWTGSPGEAHHRAGRTAQQRQTIPVDQYGEQLTCRCGLGADGMGSSTMAPCVLDENNPTSEVVVVGWSDSRFGNYWVCVNCGTAVAARNDDAAPLATIADAAGWTEAVRDVIFVDGDRDTLIGLRVWRVVGIVTRWSVAPGPDAHEASFFGMTVPNHSGRY